MKFHFTHSCFMSRLLYTNQIFEAPFYHKGTCLFLNCSYFIFVVLWFLSCTFSKWDFPGFSGRIQSFRTVILFLSLNIMKFGTLCYLIMFHVTCQNTNTDRLLKLRKKIVEKDLNFKSHLFNRRYQIIFLCLWCILREMTAIYGRIWTDIFDEHATLYEFSCKYSQCIFSSFLMFQFYYWILLIGYSSQQLIEKFHRRMSQNNLKSSTSKGLLLHTICQLQTILRLKEKIQKIYGTCVCFSQLESIIGLMFNFIAYMFQVNDGMSVYCLMRSFSHIMITFLPHWIGQRITNEVSLYYQMLRY